MMKKKTTNDSYKKFLESKTKTVNETGFEIEENKLNKNLFDSL